jgi:hypothetical protein
MRVETVAELKELKEIIGAKDTAKGIPAVWVKCGDPACGKEYILDSRFPATGWCSYCPHCKILSTPAAIRSL